MTPSSAAPVGAYPGCQPRCHSALVLHTASRCRGASFDKSPAPLAASMAFRECISSSPLGPCQRQPVASLHRQPHLPTSSTSHTCQPCTTCSMRHQRRANLPNPCVLTATAQPGQCTPCCRRGVPEPWTVLGHWCLQQDSSCLTRAVGDTGLQGAHGGEAEGFQVLSQDEGGLRRCHTG